MKILAICGSPRKRNTYSALETIKERFPEIDVEIVMLNEIHFELCRGCYACVLHGEDTCPIEDDRDTLVAKMQGADGLVLASPVYSHMVNALTKNFFDRFGFYGHRPLFFDKFTLSIATCSGYGWEHATAYMEKGLRVFGFSVVPSLGLQYKPGKVSEDQHNENNERIAAAFEALIMRIQDGARDKPSLNMLIPFGIFKAVSVVGKDVMPADYDYYRDKSDYYYDVKIPPIKRWIANKIVKRVVSKIV